MSAAVVLEARALGLRRGARTLFEGLSLALRGAEAVALTGPSGAGKSTLLRCLAGLEGYDSGEIVVGDRRWPAGAVVGLRRARALARDVGVVFQDARLFPHLSAVENVSLALEIARVPDGLARAERALTDLGLAERLEALPRELSGGEQQRVAVARCLARQPRIVLADEPTSALDPVSRELVVEALRRALDEGVALLFVTHQLELAEQLASRRLQLCGGALR
jgi:ABC-type polar amino acid transport system ATPase subunit